MGLSGLEPPTSRLSGVRSNRLSYKPIFPAFRLFPQAFGGDKRDRTADLLNAIQALSQLSYTPILYIYLTKEGGVCQVSKSIINPQSNVWAEMFHTV